MKKRGLVLLLVALITLAVSGTELKSQAATPRTPTTLNQGGKYGHYWRYTKKFPKSIKGSWYAATSNKHHYYEKVTFKTYKKIIDSKQTGSNNFYIYNSIDKTQYGSKLFYNGHWFHIEGMASLRYYRVKKMKIGGKKQSVLLACAEGTTTYFLRHKTHHIYQTTSIPDRKLMGHI